MTTTAKNVVAKQAYFNHLRYQYAKLNYFMYTHEQFSWTYKMYIIDNPMNCIRLLSLYIINKFSNLNHLMM